MSDIRITRMIITYKWETGDTVRLYSPKGRTSKGVVRKIIGGWFLSMGARILFGKSREWKTYYNRTEEASGDA